MDGHIHSVKLQNLPGEDEDVLSDGLPYEEKEHELQPRPSQVNLEEEEQKVIEEAKKIETTNIPNKKKKVKEVVVEVQEVEMEDDENEFAQGEPLKHEDKQIIAPTQEITSPSNPEVPETTDQTNDLKIDIEAAKEEVDKEEGETSPAINVIDSNNKIQNVVEAQGPTPKGAWEDSPELKPEPAPETVCITNPDKYPDQA